MPKGIPLSAEKLCLKSRNELKKHLVDLTNAVMKSIEVLDVEMKSPSDVDRGRRIAKICNYLEMANDSARYFGLGIDYRKDKKKRGRSNA